MVARQGTQSLTERTVTDLGSLRAELDRASGLGYAVQDEELMPHVAAIAVPIRHRVTGVPLGAIDIVAPAFRFPLERRLGFLLPLKAAAAEIMAIWPDGFFQLASG